MRSHRQIKDDLYGHFARVAKALGSAKRLEIVDLLAQGEKSVESIAEQASLTVGNASAQLKVLSGARLVERRRSGQYVFYRLANSSVFDFFRELQRISHGRLAEIQQLVHLYYDDRDELESVSAADLVTQIEEGAVTVLDVRPADEYRAGHLPGAVNLPVDELERRLEELSSDREIVAYCRGPYCLFSLDAIEILREAGYHARRLETGFPDWKASNLPVVSDSPDQPPQN